MTHRARVICVGIGWWVLGVVALCGCLQLVWVAAARLGIVQVRQTPIGPEYGGPWADVIGFSCLALFALGLIGISIAVVTLSRRGKLPGARDVRRQMGFAVEGSKEAV